MFTFVKAAAAKSFLGQIAKNNDTKTTVLGFVASALLMTKIDWGKLFEGDGSEIGNLAGAVVAAAIGYYINKKGKHEEPKP